MEKSFKKNPKESAEEAAVIINALLDAIRFGGADKEKMSEFAEKTRAILEKLSASSENYFAKTIAEDAVQEIELRQNIGSVGKSSQFMFNNDTNDSVIMHRKFGSFDENEEFKNLVIEEARKNSKFEGILKNINNCHYAVNKDFNAKIQDDLGINFENLSPREKNRAILYITEFLKKIKTNEIEKYKNYFSGSENKESRIKAFFSLEVDADNGDEIVEISEKLPREFSDEIFQKIAELSDLADKKNEELAKIIYKNEEKELSSNVRTKLLRKAHNLISKFSEEIGKGEDNQEKIQKLLSDLKQSRIEIDLVASLLISSKKEGGGQNLEDIKGLEISKIGEKELEVNPELWEKLREMYRTNNSHKSKEDLERLMRDFEEHKKRDPKFYLIYFDKAGGGNPQKSPDNLVGFMRSSQFDGQKELSEGERYLGAMNIDPLLQKFYFGENFMREVVEKELALGAKKLIAHVPENGPSDKIAKGLGFQDIAQEGEYKDNSGKVFAKRIRTELTIE